MPDSNHVWDFFSGDHVSQRQHSLNLPKLDSVVVIGVGGIGSWVSFNLALSGCVKILILFDDDEIEVSNLNRTPFRIVDVGKLKVVALFELIMERRPDQDVKINPIKFDPSHLNYHPTVIFDCRDDIYDDLSQYDCKIWKLGYDGLEVTIDGNPKGRKVWGESQGYTVTPSFFAPSQLAATLSILSTLTSHSCIPGIEGSREFDDVVTFDCCEIIPSTKIVQNAIMQAAALSNQGDPEYVSSKTRN